MGVMKRGVPSCSAGCDACDGAVRLEGWLRRAALLSALAAIQGAQAYSPLAVYPGMPGRTLLAPSAAGRSRAALQRHDSIARRGTLALTAQAGGAAVADKVAREAAAQTTLALSGSTLPADLSALQADLTGMMAAHPVLSTAAGASAVVLALVAATGALPKQTTSPYPKGTYDPAAAEAYYRERPFTFLQRAAFISLSAAGFGLAVLFDIITGTYEENEPKRADELTDLLTRLGPTFIKIGQSLSIRSDLLNPEYLRSLTALQDKVPAFPTEVARDIISAELGKPCDAVFSGIDKPVAAASLGQVYKASLLDGRQVAVKVQRPGIVQQVALDMHLIRTSAPLIKALGAPGDIEGLVDDWGFGFVNELNYLQEANNADTFMEGIKTTPLANTVFAPPVNRDYSSGKVLTTEWIDGERLEKSSAGDVSTLCSVAMNTYLTMMLETGTMHCKYVCDRATPVYNDAPRNAAPTALDQCAPFFRRVQDCRTHASLRQFV